jgi:hypothetical protein
MTASSARCRPPERLRLQVSGAELAHSYASLQLEETSRSLISRATSRHCVRAPQADLFAATQPAITGRSRDSFQAASVAYATLASAVTERLSMLARSEGRGASSTFTQHSPVYVDSCGTYHFGEGARRT